MTGDQFNPETYTPPVETHRSYQGMGKRKLVKDLSEHEPYVEAAARHWSSKDLLFFVRAINIPTPDPKMFDKVMAPFQRQFFESIAFSLHRIRDGKDPVIICEKCNGTKGEVDQDKGKWVDCKNCEGEGRFGWARWWVERTKKAGKDSDIALIVLWLLAFPQRKLYIEIAAVNSRQAAIIKDRIAEIIQVNPWLNEYVRLVQDKVKSTKESVSGGPLAYARIMASDEGGAHGGTPDVVIVNELTHMQTPSQWKTAEVLMSNAAGVPKGMAIIVTNAGYEGSKAQNWRNNAMMTDAWQTHCWARPAPWHSKANIKDEESQISRSEFWRLWRGKWVSGKGDALNEEDIQKCFCLNGPTMAPEKGWTYIVSLDLGVNHDHSGLVVLGVNYKEQKVRLVFAKRWEPVEQADGKKRVDLKDVKKWVLRVYQIYGALCVMFDPWQAELMSQELETQVPMKEVPPTGSNLTKMANILMQCIQSQKIECYDDETIQLRQDFGKLTIVSKSYGYKLEAPSDERGHADVAMALVLGLPTAFELLDAPMGLRPDDDIVDTSEEPLSEEEVEELPDALKGVYEMEEELEDDRPMRKGGLNRDPFDPFEDIV